jgi:hypothetical protein
MEYGSVIALDGQPADMADGAPVTRGNADCLATHGLYAGPRFFLVPGFLQTMGEVTDEIGFRGAGFDFRPNDVIYPKIIVVVSITRRTQFSVQLYL